MKNGKLIKKGYGKYLSFNFEEDVLIHWLSLKKEVENINKISNGEMTESILLLSIWESFNAVVENAISNKEIQIFFSAHTVLETKTVVYFSKNPTNHGGLPTGSRTFLHPYPVKTLEFQNKCEREVLYEGIISDLDISAYWTFFLQKFSKYFICTINQGLKKGTVLTLQDPYELFHESGMDFFNFYKKNKSIFNIFCKLSYEGFFLFFKDRDKKSFPKNKMIQTKLYSIPNKENLSFPEYIFKNYTRGSVEGVTIAANLQDCWESNICCLDFDNFEELFTKEKFDETSNLKHKNFLCFLLLIKKNGIFIYSSPTNTPFDRFKVLFKFKGKPANLTYSKFKKEKQYLENRYGFNIEDFASIVGVSMAGLELISPNNKYDLCEVDFDKFNKFFTESKVNNILELKYFENLTYKDLLVELFEERSYRERTIYNKSLNEDGLKKMHIFNTNKYDISELKNDFDQIFIDVLKKENKLNLTLDNFNLVKEYYSYPYDGGMERKIYYNGKIPDEGLP